MRLIFYQIVLPTRSALEIYTLRISENIFHGYYSAAPLRSMHMKVLDHLMPREKRWRALDSCFGSTLRMKEVVVEPTSLP